MTAPERRVSTARAIAIAAAIIFAASNARADADTSADETIDPTSTRIERLADEAFARASGGAFSEALALYRQAYELAPSAAIAFDIAWLHDVRLGAPSSALEWYRRAAAAPDVAPELAARARERIAALEAASETARPLTPGASASSGSGAGANGPPKERDATWSPLRSWAILAGGSGLVAFAVGAGFAVVAKNKDREAGRYCDGDRCTDARALTLTDEATSAATVANVAIVTGAVLAATGVTLWLLAPRHGAVDVSVRSSGAAGFAPSLWLGGSLP